MTRAKCTNGNGIKIVVEHLHFKSPTPSRNKEMLGVASESWNDFCFRDPKIFGSFARLELISSEAAAAETAAASAAPVFKMNLVHVHMVQSRPTAATARGKQAFSRRAHSVLPMRSGAKFRSFTGGILRTG